MLAQYHFELGLLTEIKLDFDKAIKHFQKAHNLSPGNKDYKKRLDLLLNP